MSSRCAEYPFRRILARAQRTRLGTAVGESGLSGELQSSKKLSNQVGIEGSDRRITYFELGTYLVYG